MPKRDCQGALGRSTIESVLQQRKCSAAVPNTAAALLHKLLFSGHNIDLDEEIHCSVNAGIWSSSAYKQKHLHVWACNCTFEHITTALLQVVLRGYKLHVSLLITSKR